MKAITIDEFVKMVRLWKGTKGFEITYFVDEGKSKTVNGKKLIQKLVTVVGIAGVNYQKRVNTLLKKLGLIADFVAYANNGVEQAFEDSAILLKNKKGELMFRCHINSNVKPKTTYFYKGLEISLEEAVKADLFTPSFFQKKSVGRGAVVGEKAFKVMQPFLKNIIRMRVNGETYELIK